MARIESYAPPTRLYRYRDLADGVLKRELEAMSEGYVFCPSFAEMNDPMEGAHAESALLQEAKGYAITVAQVTEAKAALGIASFAETHLSEPMWAYYAGAFRGMCIAYNFKKLLNELDDDNVFVRMAYNEKAPMLVRNSQTAEQRARMVLSTKAVRWSQEREWRLIRPGRGPAAYRSANCVAGVYLGSRVSAEHQQAVRAATEQLKIPLWRMEIDKYAVSFKKVPRRVMHKRKLVR